MKTIQHTLLATFAAVWLTACVTDPNSPARHPFEPREADLATASRPAPSPLEKFLGGSPSSVAVRPGT